MYLNKTFSWNNLLKSVYIFPSSDTHSVLCPNGIFDHYLQNETVHFSVLSDNAFRVLPSLANLDSIYALGLLF